MDAAVDIVIAAYNPGVFLSEMLASLVEQTHTRWRAFVVDDGSTEDLSWVTGVDERIELIHQNNQGQGAARNTGIAAGSAEFVAFVDADDKWLPGKLDAQLKAMAPGVVLCSTAFEIIDRDGNRTGDGYKGFATSRAELLQGDGICLSTTLTRRDALTAVGNFDASLRIAQDWDLWIRLAGIGTLVKLPEILAQYRIHGGNVTADYRRVNRIARAMLKRYAHGPDAPLAEAGRRRINEITAAQAFDAFRSTRRPVHLVRALAWSPRYTLGALASKLRDSLPL